MSRLDDYLRALIREAQAKFPDAGILFVTVEDNEDDENRPEITYMTNMGPEEMTEVVAIIAGPESAPVGATLN